MNLIDPRKLILKQYQSLFYERHAYKVGYSGRNSGKSVNIIRALLLLMLSHRNMVIVCAREIMASIADSSYAEIVKQIKEMKLEQFFKITKTTIEVPASGSSMCFKGLYRNIESIKGIADINIIWFEEAQTISMESITMSVDTLREAGAEAWFSFNPKNPTDAVSQLFIENEPPPSTIIINTNYDENPFVNDDKLIQIEHLRDTDYNQYCWRYLGQYLDTAENNIFPLSDIKRATEREYDVPKGIIKAGLDPSAEGDDKMVLTIIQGNRVLHIQAWNYMSDEVEFADKLTPILYNWKVDVLGVDSVGLGHGLCSVMKHRYKAHSVVGVDCRRVSGIPECATLKDEMLWELRESMRNKLSIPNCKELIEDLQVSKYTYNSKDKWVVVGKKELKKKFNYTRSTDYLDSLAIANWITFKKKRDVTSLASR